MNILKLKELINNMFNLKINKNKIKKLPPISLVNKPIVNNDDDLLGYTSQVALIEQAIEDGANMIGIIAEYGAGKSSLTDILSVSDKFKEEPIKINLWDCLIRNNENDKGVSEITKSFLYQLALGNHKNKTLAQYVNKRLSKNFGILSLSITDKSIWVCIILLLIMYLIPTLSIEWINMVVENGKEILDNWINWFIYKKEIFYICGVLVFVASIMTKKYKYIVLSIIAAFPHFMINMIENITSAGVSNLAIWLPWWKQIENVLPLFIIGIVAYILSKCNIAFSLWDSQGKREPEISDIYSVYSEIVNNICAHTSKPQLVVIEDLDRTDDRIVVQSFLKELYRFNNLLSKEMKKKIIFVTAVKPESSLKDNTKKDKLEMDIYSKVFDYTFYLGAIHNDDYKTIVINLLKPLNNKIYKLTGIDLSKENFPSEFSWLVKGKNLSVRDIKNRINIAFSVYYRLKTLKQVDGFDIKFENCAIVAYLHETYPQTYPQILTYEKLLNDMVKIAKYNRISAKKTPEEQCTFLCENIKKEFKFIVEKEENFIREFSELLQKNLISDDYRMYFYNYPKDGYIYTIDERIVRDYILEPLDEVDKIEDKILEVKKFNPQLIKNTIDEYVEQKLGIPKSIYKSHTILIESYNIYPEEVINELCNRLRWEEHQQNNSKNLLNYLANSEFINKNQMITELISKLLPDFVNLPKELVVKCRKIIMQEFKNHLKQIKELFISQNMPIISKEEIFDIYKIDERIEYIKEDVISVNNAEYIADAITTNYDDNSTLDKCIGIFRKLMEVSPTIIVCERAIMLLKKNNLINEEIFCKALDMEFDFDKEIGEYLDSLNIESIPNEYFEAIEKRNMNKNLSDKILYELKDRKYYISYLLSMRNSNKMCEINFAELDKETFIQKMYCIYKYNVDEFIILRKCFVKSHIFDESYKKMFFSPYPQITLDEIVEIQPFHLGLEYIDTNIFSNSSENIELLSIYANMFINNNEEFVNLIDFICCQEYSFEDSYIRGVFYKLNFEKIKFYSLSEHQKLYIVDKLFNIFNLEVPKNAIDFMMQVKCPIGKLEEQICDNTSILKDEISEQYFKFISEVKKYTTQTIEICKKNYFNVPLFEEIEREFLIEKDNISYLISNILRNNVFTFDSEKIEFQISDYSKVYENIEECRNIMNKNAEFLLYLVRNKGYEKFNLELLLPLLKVRQTIDIVKYAFSKLSTTDEKKKYLLQMSDLDTEEDSRLFGNFMAEDANIELVRNDNDVKNAIIHRLWNENQKKKYRRSVNRYFNT